MKKTLLLTVLLAGTAMADTTAETDRVIYTSHVTYGTDGYANITTEHGTHDVQMSMPSFTCIDLVSKKEVTYIGTTHTVGVNVGEGGGFMLTLNFPVSAAYDEYTISNISVALGLNNAEGTTYPLANYELANGGQAPTVNITARVLQNGTELESVAKTYTYYDSGANQYATGFNFGELYGNEEIKLTGAFTLEITIDGDVLNKPQSDFYVSVDNVEISGMAPRNYTIPEPTTATLSLLALAGLAARRRRK